MTDKTFAETEITVAGLSYPIEVGQVWRKKVNTDAFDDFVVLGIHRGNRDNHDEVLIARPYAYASCVGSTSPGVLMGYEKLAVQVNQFVERFVCLRKWGDFKT